MRCNHCPFGSLGQFLQLLQRRLFGPFGPRTEFSMGSMWNVPTCSIERAQFFIPLDRRDAGIVRHPRCRGRVVFLSPAAPIFIWGICTHRWLLLHSCNMCYMPCSRRNNNSPGTSLLRSPAYSGPQFSWGDRYISDCARGKTSCGNLTTWRRVGTSHHIAYLNQQIANHASS